MRLIWELFYTFAKIGLFTFGGGYAMIPIIENICVERKQWITHDDMMYITVIAESTPGPIAINCATFVGCKQKGVWGAVAATVGVVLPSFVIIYLIALTLDHFLDITIVANALKGIKLAVGLLILNAAIKLIRKMDKRPLSRILLGMATALMLGANIFSQHISSIVLALIGGVIGLAVFLVHEKSHTDVAKGGDLQ